MMRPEDILTFWLDELQPKDWYNGGAALDVEIRSRFEGAWNAAMDGDYGLWLTYPTGSLAYLLLVDQFPRNMFRDSGKAFASDPLALAVAKLSIHQKWDMRISGESRQFFYLPLTHSEVLADQDRAVRLFKTNMPDAEENLRHARAHREVIREFGRFPTRNAALGRRNTPAEASYLVAGGYGATLKKIA